jgi:threonine aldolase
MKTIDLRSDTVTLPTDKMRKAMAEAEVGDDVYGEDPTINRLEALAAARAGKAAAVFMTSGTLSNLVGVLSQTSHGNEVIVGSQAHILWYEVGGTAALGGVILRTVPNDKQGRLGLDDIKNTIRAKGMHFPETKLICLENTHNRCGGAVLTADYTNQVCDLAHANGLRVHLDGARLFNAAVALRVPAAALCERVDTVSFCFSKGLSAPVGSVLCGDVEVIGRARKFRKMLGGGMRQAGVLAAAGILALETMVDRLQEDHDSARHLAERMASLPGIILDLNTVMTNIVRFDLAARISPQEFTARALERGVKVSALGGPQFRCVTNRMVGAGDIDMAADILESVLKGLA